MFCCKKEWHVFLCKCCKIGNDQNLSLCVKVGYNKFSHMIANRIKKQ